MRYIALALVFASLPAFACPDLSGTYEACTSSSGTGDPLRNVVITQDGTSYTMEATDGSGSRTTTMIYGDGRPMVVTETDAETGMTFTTTTTGSCSDTELTLASSVEVNGEVIGTLNNVVMKDGAALTQTISGELFGQQVADTVTCQ